MIQGDNLIGSSMSSNSNLNMENNNRLLLALDDNRAYDNSLNSGIDMDSAQFPGVLESINTSDLLPAGVSYNIDDFDLPNAELLFGDVQENEIIESTDQTKNDAFPDLTEHDHANLEFSVILNQPENLAKNNWYFSNPLKKIFISLNKNFHVDIQYKPVEFNLFLRVMMVFIDELCSPVKRCQNHKFSEKGVEPDNKNFSIIRTENPRAQYCGIEDGKSINDRLSVLIPLSNVVPDQKNMARQSIALKFVCQNSCIGRKQTAVIFILENNMGRALSKRILNVKVCSCPKRDKAAEEQKNQNPKRTAEQANHVQTYGHRPAKIPKIKQETILLSPPMSSPSPPTSNSDDNISNHVPIKLEIPTFLTPPIGILHLPDGGVNLTLRLPNTGIATELMRNAFNIIAGEISRNPQNADWSVYLDELKKWQNK